MELGSDLHILGHGNGDRNNLHIGVILGFRRSQVLAAHRLIGRFATDHQKQHRPPTSQDTNVLGLLLSSTRDRVSREGHAYLVTRGHHPVTESSAYSMLVACYEKEVQDRTGSQLF